MAAENFKVKKGLEVGTAITATSSGINVTGIITATQLVGDGSGLTGVVGSGSGVVVKDEGSAVGTAGTINFVGSGVAATLSAGTATVTINAGGLDNVVEDTTPELGGNLDLNSKFVTGSGGINVTGVVTATTLKGNGDFVDIDVDGQTEVDDLNVAGISTFNDDVTFTTANSKNIVFDKDANDLTFGDNVLARFGDSNDLNIYHDSTSSNVVDSYGALNIKSNVLTLRASDNTKYIEALNGSTTKLYFAGNQKLTTTINGIEVPDLNVTGVGTFGRVDTNGVTLGTNNNNFAAKFIDDAVANFGTDNDLKISHDDTHARITNTKGNIVVSGIISATSDVKVGSAITMDPTSGIITATSFSGSGSGLTSIPSAQLSGALPALDGSALTGITASGSGIIVKHDGSTVGTAGTINFSTNLDVSAISAGIVTVTASGGGGDKIEEGDTKVETVDSGDAADAYVTTEVNGTEEIRTIGGQTTIKYLRVGSNWNMANSTGNGISLNYSNTHDLISSSASSGLDIRSNTSIELGQNGSPNHKYASITDSAAIFRTTNTERFRINASGIQVGQNAVSVGATITIGGNATFAGIVTATTFSGALASSNLTGALPAISGVNLTSLNASELDSGTIPNGRFPTTLPAISGVNLTALNASEITSGTLPIARIADDAVTFAKIENVGTSRIIGRTSSGTGNIETLSASEVRTLLNVADGATAGITTAPSNITATWSVTASDFSGYEFTGPGQDGSEDDPDIYLVRGHKYRFINTTGSSHPFRFKVSAGGSTYTDGISGSENGTQDFSVQHDAPASLVYQCTQHPAMVGNIYIVGQHLANGANNRVLTATSAYGMTGESTLTYNGSGTLEISDSGSSYTLTGSSAKHEIGASASDNDLVIQNNKNTVNATSNIIFKGSGAGGESVKERLRIASNGELRIPAGIGAQLRFENQHSVTTDAVISTFDDASGTLLCLGSNFYFNSAGSETRYNTSEESSAIVMNRNGQITLKTGDTGATATTRLNIDSTGQVSIGGNTSVGTKLHIENSSGDAHIRLRGSANFGVLYTRHSDGALIGYTGSGNAVNLGASNLGISASLSGGNIVFQTGGTASSNERLRITSGGNVNIGGDYTQTSYKLSVNGSAIFKHTEADIWLHSTGANKIWRILGSTGGSTHQFRIYDESVSSDRLKIGNTGRVDVPEVYGTAISSPMRDLYIESTGQLGYQPSIIASKINIADNDDVSWLYNLAPKTYNNRKRVSPDTNEWTNEAESDLQYGLIAEEVESVNSNICFYDVDDSNNKTLAGVTYSQLITPLLKALQEQKAEIDALKTRVATLEGS